MTSCEMQLLVIVMHVPAVTELLFPICVFYSPGSGEVDPEPCLNLPERTTDSPAAAAAAAARCY